MKKYLSIFIVLLLVSCTQEVVSTFGEINGVVVDSDTKEALQGVSVSLDDDGSSIVTGSDGTYRFSELTPQTYTITYKKEGYSDETKNVKVVAGSTNDVDIVLHKLLPVMSISVDKLEFGADKTILNFDISNTGEGTLEWSISEDVPWLTCSPASGKTTKEISPVVVSISRDGMQKGSYSQALVITSNGGSKVVNISMVVEGASLSISPSELDFGTAETQMQVTLSNTNPSGSIITYSVKSSNDWLILDKSSGSVSANDYVKVTVNRNEMSAGSYAGTIVFTAGNDSFVIPVHMEIVASHEPVVSFDYAEKVEYDSATLRGTIVSVGSAKVTKHGFCWSKTNTEPTLEDESNNMGDCTTPMSFEGKITKLEAETKYYVRAYAENEVGLSYSKVSTFTTLGLPELASVTTGEVISSGQDFIKIEGSVTSLGNVSSLSAVGHVLSTETEPTLENGKITNLGEVSELKKFESIFEDLEAHTQYFIRSYATNEKGTSYGNVVSCYTKNSDVVLETPEIKDIIHNEATFVGKITDNGGYTIVEKGFCWSESKNPTISNNKVETDDSFTARITGLATLKTYYVRAYAKTSEDSFFYSQESNFTTTKEVKIPNMGTLSVLNISTTSVTAICNITSDGGGDITDCGVCYSLSPSPKLENAMIEKTDASQSEIKKVITDLTEGVTYYITAFAQNAKGVAYSNEVEFTTLAIEKPTLGETSIIRIGKTKATVQARLESDGNSDLQEFGFCWSTNSYPTINDNKVQTNELEYSNEDKYIKAELENLPLLTTVYVRAYATNAKGTSYNTETSFTTIEIDTDIWNGDVASDFDGGLGTQSNPILISSGSQLKLLSDNVNNGRTYSGNYFKLDANIDLNNIEWTPIGSSSNPFKGSFDGNNCSITNLKISTSNDYNGLFGYITQGGCINNLSVEGNVSGSNYVGGLCGYIGDIDIIDNVHIDCKVEGISYIGGIAGYIATLDNSIVLNCSNKSTIEGENHIGGISGYLSCQSGSSNRYLSVINNVNYGSIIASNKYAGGITGYMYLYYNPYDTKKSVYIYVKNCVNYSQVQAVEYKGGINGIYSNTYGNLEINNCYWLNDAVLNVGIEKGFGSTTPESCEYYMRTATSCALESGNDLVEKLNTYIDNNTDGNTYRKWKYTTINGYPTPTFE